MAKCLITPEQLYEIGDQADAKPYFRPFALPIIFARIAAAHRRGVHGGCGKGYARAARQRAYFATEGQHLQSHIWRETQVSRFLVQKPQNSADYQLSRNCSNHE